ncbi:571_t:CDS:2 [Rhizophagus irregularis]|nr:571_t:CDS:2 [Rhizophagus irregularis]
MSLTSRNAQSTNWDNPGSQKTLSQISTKIYGEYYSGKIDSVWKATTENFIFSFANDNDTKDMKICRMNYHDVTYNTGNYKKLCFGFAFKISRQHLYINNSYYNDDNVLKRMLMPVPEEIEGPRLILIETSHTCNPVNDSWDNWNSWNVQPNRTKNKRRSPQIDTTSVSNGWGRPPPHPDGGGWDLANNIPVNNDDDWGSVNNNDSWTNWSTTLDESSRDSSISLWQTSDPPRQTVTDQPSLAQDLTKIYGEYQSHIHIHNGQQLNYGNKFNFSNVFRMNGSDIEVNNSAYNDKNVINPNIKMFVPKEIEVFLISSK